MFCEDVLCGFTSVLHFPHPSSNKFKREYRTVVLPDFQGIGLGVYLRDFIANLYTERGFRFITTTTNPALIFSMKKSKNWILCRIGRSSTAVGPKGMSQMKKSISGTDRITTSWEFLKSSRD